MVWRVYFVPLAYLLFLLVLFNIYPFVAEETPIEWRPWSSLSVFRKLVVCLGLVDLAFYTSIFLQVRVYTYRVRNVLVRRGFNRMFPEGTLHRWTLSLIVVMVIVLSLPSLMLSLSVFQGSVEHMRLLVKLGLFLLPYTRFVLFPLTLILLPFIYARKALKGALSAFRRRYLGSLAAFGDLVVVYFAILVFLVVSGSLAAGVDGTLWNVLGRTELGRTHIYIYFREWNPSIAAALESSRLGEIPVGIPTWGRVIGLLLQLVLLPLIVVRQDYPYELPKLQQ